MVNIIAGLVWVATLVYALIQGIHGMPAYGLDYWACMVIAFISFVILITY